MNHTQRIEETARRYRYLTRRAAKEAVETYLALMADDIASGEWVEIPGIGRLRVTIEEGAGIVMPRRKGERQVQISVKRRLRTQIRLSETLKRNRYK